MSEIESRFELWRLWGAALFVATALACFYGTRDMRLEFFRIVGESIAITCSTSAVGVLLRWQRLSTSYACACGTIWFVLRGGPFQLLQLIFSFGIFSIALLWIFLPLTGLAVAYLLVMRNR